MAGITHLEQFQKPALLGLVDATVEETMPTFADRYIPNENTFSTKFAYDIIKSNKYIAAMIGHGAEPPVVDRNQVASMAGEIAKMGLKYIATEEELLALHQARSGAESQAMIDNLTFEGVQLVQAMQRRIDVIKMEALTKGQFAYKKHGVEVTVDFGIPAENKKVLSDSTWADASHDVIGDLLEWNQAYEDANGEAPDAIYMSREVQALLLKNTTIVTEAAGSGSGRTRVSVDELNSVLGGYGLPAVNVVTNRKVTVKNVADGSDEVIEFFPVNRVVMLSEGVGKFLLGPTVENEFQPGIVLTAEDLRAPIRSVLETVAAGFPTIEQPSRIFHADVYAV
ncbi:major capsid protein [Bacillus sp. 7894-2]|uniref:major capsid protein n=1 Tax=Bacillus sp. 7894-2 TaxID=2021695 RepID=UPI000BA6D5C5|nr:major capsid protein [Bacillus sp. 7894-2]PAE24071.1 major capsid protein E [Bacillus sp. 7894-2]